ncbi:unnamed protein product [Rotaria sordida]|uniref:Uncharacterized protein n=1 Tax=Rotaria sordida TaxID=392033 RepID=A0A813XBX5_9BILA|nr:unnamed protein product [Rotaria sordida]CAF0884957.1 unnamed protein product [Rotaria sordida]
MATPLPTVHIAHVSRTARRRSQSIAVPNRDPKDNIRVQSIGRKEFMAQLQKERLKHQNKHDEQEETHDEQQDDEEKDHRQPTGNRLSKSTRTTSMRKTATSGRVSVTTVKREQSSKTAHVQEDEQNHMHQMQATRIPQIESTMSFNKSNPTPLVRANSHLDSSQTLSNPLTTSSIPLITSNNFTAKSEIFNQEFLLNDGKNHPRKKDVKDYSSITINKQAKHYNGPGIGQYASSSASFMSSIVGIMLGLIAFTLSLTALILVLLLRSTVYANLATNSTTSSSSSSGSLPSSCSSYTTIDDPTRSISAAGYALGCDNTSPFINRTFPVWIRFIGTGGSTLPLQTPGMNLCGSEGTGWYDGTMPSSTGAIVNGTACFTWYNSVCRFSSSISVANCDSYYIYLLPPAPACMMRYCTI